MRVYTDTKLRPLSTSLTVSPVKRRPGGVVNWKQLRNGGGRDALQLAIIVWPYIYRTVRRKSDGDKRTAERE